MIKQIHHDVGQWMKDMREQSGVSIEEAARKMETQSHILIEYENGRPLPLPIMIRLAQTYRVHPHVVVMKLLDTSLKSERRFPDSIPRTFQRPWSVVFRKILTLCYM